MQSSPHAPSGAVFVLQVAVTLLLMGAIPLLIRLVDASSFAIGIVRLAWALSLTLAAFGRKLEWRRLRAPEEPRERLILVAIGLFFGAHWYTYFEAIQRSSATLGILALSTYGIHVTWLGALFSSRRPTGVDWFAVALAAAGAAICLPLPDQDHGAFIGFLLGIVSGLFYAALPLLHQKVSHVNLPTRGAAQFFFAWLLFLPFAGSQNWRLSSQTWLYLSLLGILCTFVAHNLWISITTRVRPSTAGLLYYLALPVTMLLETVVLLRPPSSSQILGACLIVGGNALALSNQQRRPPARTKRC